MYHSRPLRFALALALLPLAVPPATADDAPAASPSGAPKVAVVDFSCTDGGLGTSIADQVSAAMEAYDGCSVVDRSDVQQVLEKVKLPAGSPVGADLAQKLGKQVAAGRLIVGSCAVRDEQVTLTARLIDARTGRPVADGGETVAGGRQYVASLARRLAHRLRAEMQSGQTCGDGSTGLVVDATGLPLQRAMGPRILDEDGHVLYPVSNRHVPAMDILEDQGMAAYITGDAAPIRSGDQPLIVRAVGVAGPKNEDLVVSRETAQQILQANERAGFLEGWAVSIQLKAVPVKISVIHFKNGDVLTGIVLRKKEGSCTVKTDIGQFTVAEDKIETIADKE
jgi:TolB-like protein